ncbi:hypothetical protein FACS18942_03350 [Planctomycetales bacterium]|nr:hypothetical protein FACS18942_03350 [Planctomycetales bacterium]
MLKNYFVSSLLLLISAVMLSAQDTAPVKQNPLHFPPQELGTQPPVLKGIMPLSEEELREGWFQLFDGISLFGWKTVDGQFIVRNGILMSNPKTSGLIRYNSKLINGTVSGQRRNANGQNAWTDFTMKSETEDAGKAGDWSITLESGQYRDVRFKPAGLKNLFDGKTLNGWKINPNSKPETKATVEDGAIHLTGGSGSLETEESFADFILQLEYKTDKPVNSGVFFRCIPGELMNGYECQVFNHPPAGDYQKFIGTDTGGIFRRQVGRNIGTEDGQWNFVTIFVRGQQITTWVNGVQTTDFVDERDANPNPRKGFRREAGTIQLQGHDPATDIWFRNIKITAIK